jgi:hypothetical protein
MKTISLKEFKTFASVNNMEAVRNHFADENGKPMSVAHVKSLMAQAGIDKLPIKRKSKFIVIDDLNDNTPNVRVTEEGEKDNYMAELEESANNVR